MAIEHSIEYYRSHLIEMAGRVKSMMDKCGNADHKKQLAELYEHILGVGHGNPMDVGHSFVPLGCDCLRS